MQDVHLSSWRRVVKLRSARLVFTGALWMQGQFIPLCGIYLFSFRTELTQKKINVAGPIDFSITVPCTLFSLPKRAFNFVGAQ